jgi:hypothetical protein
MSALNLNSTCTRLFGGAAAQAGNAAAAEVTASWTSAAMHWGASAMTSPVEGL